jgi:hypothetical protein
LSSSKKLCLNVCIFKSDSEYVQWVEFTKCLNSDMLLGCVYIQPENSKYSSEEAFIEVEDELLFYSRDHKNIALAVDFNIAVQCSMFNEVKYIVYKNVKKSMFKVCKNMK